MDKLGWWLLLGTGLLLALGGVGYVAMTQRQSGPRWDRLLPEAKLKAQQVIAAATAAGLDVMFWDGWRSPETSAANMQAGTSKVKNPLDSLHVWGAAFDIVFKNAAGLPEWPPETDPRWRQLAEIGRRLGLVSGGLAWGWDWPHFQLVGYTAGLLRAQNADNYLAFLQRSGAQVA